MKTTNTFLDHVDALAVECYSDDSCIYRVLQEEFAGLWECIPCVNLNLYNQTYLYLKFSNCGEPVYTTKPTNVCM